MNRLGKAIGIGALILASLSSPNLANIVRAEEAKQPTLAEQCKEHKKYVPKPEIRAKYDALEVRYNSECHENKNCGPVIAELEALVKLDPNYPDPYLRLGTAFIETKDYEKAIPYLEKAVQLEPCNAETYRNLAIAHFRVGLKNNNKDTMRIAISDAEKVCQLDPSSQSCKEASNLIKNVKNVYLKE